MGKNHNPDWYKLTKLLKVKGKINTGLTIPYIFGAYKLLGKPLANISDLLDELRRDKIDKYPVIQECGDIHQHVVAVEEKHIYNRNGINCVKLYNARGEIDLVISPNTNLGNTAKAVYKNLVGLYDSPINAGTFSWNNKERAWKPFEKEEEILILTLKYK